MPDEDTLGTYGPNMIGDLRVGGECTLSLTEVEETVAMRDAAWKAKDYKRWEHLTMCLGEDAPSLVAEIRNLQRQRDRTLKAPIYT